MSSFQIINEKRFPLKVKDIKDNVDLLDYYRWEHRVTIGSGFHKYMIFLDNLKQVVYIEDVTNGNLEEIEDEPLWEAIFRWVTEHKFLEVLMPLAKPPGYNKCKIRTMNEIIKVR